MDDGKLTATEMYLVALRTIQPARVQDILKAYNDIWRIEITESVRNIVFSVHAKMRADGLLVDVRKGTFILDSRGMSIAARLVSERSLDNARLFLMKSQRKQYHRIAGRQG